jgi:hypothetical protein
MSLTVHTVQIKSNSLRSSVVSQTITRAGDFFHGDFDGNRAVNPVHPSPRGISGGQAIKFGHDTQMAIERGEGHPSGDDPDWRQQIHERRGYSEIYCKSKPA